MSLVNWRKFILTNLLLILFLTLTTAVGLAQSTAGIPQAGAAGSSITICLGNNINQPDTVQFSGDLGSFTLSGLNACKTFPGLFPGAYTINENLPAGYFGLVVHCSETAGSGLSQWQTTAQSAVIDLAAGSEVECRFYSLENPDEPNDTMEQATPTNYGGTVNAAIGPHPDVGPDGDKDFYKFKGYAGDTIFVDADVYDFSFSTNPVWITLRNESGAVLAQQTNNSSPFLTLEHQLLETGDYYLEIWVDCVNNNQICTGDYGWYMGLVDPYEPNDTPATAAPIKFNDRLRGYMDNDDGDPIIEKDADYFHFQGKAGDKVVIDVSRFNDETVPDCSLENAAGTILASDFGPTCRIEYILPAAGQYYINVFSQYHEGLINYYWRGPYQLSLRYKNAAPLALPDSYLGYAGQSLVVPAPGVLDNDSDEDGDDLTAVLTGDVQHGSLNLAGDGSFTYEPDPGFTGSDSFQYHAFDGLDPSGPVTVTITINPQTLYLPMVLVD
jgi:hypothetical protein